VSAYSTFANTGMRVCPTCNGTGINPLATYMVCPKCNGEKVVPFKVPRPS
jgi:DnaJ-class molecular chaperone